MPFETEFELETESDLNLILMQGCNGELDDNAMQIIAVVKWLRDTYELPIEEICTLFTGIKDYGKGEQTVPGDLFNRKFNNGHSTKINDLSGAESDSRLRAGLGCSEYEYGTIHNHEPRRDRRLLLRKSELKKIERRVTEKGMTLVPYRLYFSERGFIKLEVFLAQGKKAYDKRDSIKERQNKRDLDRIKKEYS